LEHEDAGMMGLIRVEPRAASQSNAPISNSPAAAME